MPEVDVLILDDSIEVKPYTDENECNCQHYFYMQGLVLEGINLLSCNVKYYAFSISAGYEIIYKNIQYANLEMKIIRQVSRVILSYSLLV